MRKYQGNISKSKKEEPEEIMEEEIMEEEIMEEEPEEEMEEEQEEEDGLCKLALKEIAIHLQKIIDIIDEL